MTGAPKYASRESDQYMMRFPEGLRDRIKEAAKASGRSMNTEIVMRLGASFETSRQLSPAIAEIINEHVEQEVTARLRAIAAKIGGAA